MDLAIEDVDAFAERIRRRRLRRIAIFGLLAFAGWLGYHQYRPRLDDWLAFPAPPPPDDPRVLLSRSAADSEHREDLAWFRRLFSTELPDYLRELRRWRSLNARRPGADDGTRLAAARSTLLDYVTADEALRAVVSLVVKLSEEGLATHEARILDLFDGLNVVLADRSLPFFAEAHVVSAAVPTLQVRCYEVIATRHFRIGGETYPLRYLERLDMKNYDRDPDRLPWRGEAPTLPVRAVLATANRGLLAALHPGGCWCLSRVDPPARVAWVEPAIGQEVFDRWRDDLEPTVPPGAWTALVSVSAGVARRNRVFRAANQRDPDHIVTLSPSSVRLNEYGKAWLKEMEPYAARGLVRLQLEDMIRIRRNDKAIGEYLDASAPALQAVLHERLRLAAIGEVQRAHLVRTSRMPSRLIGRVAGDIDDPTAIAWVSESLSWLAAARVTCAGLVGDLIFEAIDGDYPEAAAWVLGELTGIPLRAQDLDAGTLSSVARKTLDTPCDTLQQSAKDLFGRHFAPWQTPESSEAVGIARQGPVSR